MMSEDMKIKKNKKRKSKDKVQQVDDGQNTVSQDGENEEESQVGSLQDDDHDASKSNFEEDSDTEEKPKRKKKKKTEVASEPTDSKGGKKSKRQIKRERYAQRKAQAVMESKATLKSECLSYLSQWKHNRDNWKFMKVKQIWLFKNKFSSALIPNETWPVLLEYFASAKGNIWKLLLEDANNVIKQLDDWTESQNNGKTEEQNNDEENETETKEFTKPDDTAYKRARDLIQRLQ